MQNKEKRLVFRPARHEEKRVFKSFLATITTCKYSTILQNRLLYGLYGGFFIELFAITQNMLDLILLLNKTDVQPYSAGFPLGIVKKGGFKPSLPLAKILFKKCRHQTLNFLVLDEKAERKYLYGRDVFVDIKKTKQPYTIKKQDYVIVVNTRFDVLGWGFIVEKVKGKVKLQNIIDVGWYLRSGG